MESVDVELAAGVPVSFVCVSRRWNAGVTPVHWFERVAWWQTARRAPRGSMFHIDVEAWQVQARIGHSHRAPLVTFELVLGQDRETRMCRSVDAVAA